MRVIGLTGGIAGGKSTASSHLERLGARIVDADVVSRGITADGAPALADLAAAFPGVVAAGRLDRAALAQSVFFDPEKRRRLEAILHPRIRAEVDEAVAAARREGVAFLVLSVPLMFESGMDALCDEIWAVDAAPALRVERMAARGLARDEARARIASQMPDDERNRRADVVLDGSGPPERLFAQIDARWARLQGTEHA